MSAGGGESPQAKWEFCTQWSVPPDEGIEIIAPGYMGWRSGEPAGPYWGRTGQSAEWPRTGQGFPNFRLENIYLGIIPVAFGLLACLMAWRRILAADTVGEKAWRMDVRFWSVVALVVLLLSFGKYFPLYSLFYHLPVVNNIRNPNKFIQVLKTTGKPRCQQPRLAILLDCADGLAWPWLSVVPFWRSGHWC
jgi:hypothetical protein